VLRGDLRGRAPGDLPADLQRLEHHDPEARTPQLQGRAQADHAGADDRDVRLEIALQGRLADLAVRDRSGPERFSLPEGP
jgi:hypothetical protein